MAVKIQYPVQLHKDTKCPSCNMPIKEIGNLLYVCDTGHVLEALVLVTMRPKQKQEPVKVNSTDGNKKSYEEISQFLPKKVTQ